MKTITLLAALCGFSGVALGAFGAHALRARLAPEQLEIYRTGVLYQLVHAAALLGLAAAAERVGRPRVVAGLFAAGVLVFSGSLYLLAVTGERRLGAITPLGGVAFILGWLALLLPPPKARP